MADYIFPYGEAPDDANYVVTEPSPDLPNADVLVPGDNISITVGNGTVTISSTGGGTDEATFITADDETSDLPNSFRIMPGSNIALDYVGSQLIISASVSGSGGGTVESVSAGNLSPIFTTNVATPTTTPNITFTIANGASGVFLRGAASGAAAPLTLGGILGTDLTGALSAGANITITPATDPGSRLTIATTGLQPLSSTLNALSTGTGPGFISQADAVTFNYRAIAGTANRITVSNGDGTGGNPTIDVGANVYTISSSNVLNDLASSTSTGIVVQSDSAGHHVYRTIQGTTGEIIVTNGSGISGNPVLSLDSSVYTDRDSSVLNALATGLTGTGFVSQNGAAFYDRTLTGTTDRVTITNPTGAAGDPVFDVGQDVLVVGDITALAGIQIVNGTGVVQIGASGALGGTLSNLTVGDIDPLYVTNVTDPTTTPVVSFVLNDLASGALLIGPKDGTDAQPTLRRLLGQDLTDAISAGSNITFSLVDDHIQISSTASGGGGGTVTEVSAEDLPPLFTTNVTNSTTTPNLVFTLNNAASGTFFSGPASGANASPDYRQLVGLDLLPALEAGSNITLAMVGDRLRISSSGGGSGGYSTIEEDGNPLTQRSTINFVGSGITASDNDPNTDVTLASFLNDLVDLTDEGVLVRTDGGPIVRTLTGTANRVTVTNGNGVSGNPTVDVGTDVYTISSSNVLNDLASSTSTGMMAQTDSIGHHAYRTITGTGNRVSVTNGNGVSGDPTLDVGTDVYTISTSNILNNIASSTGTGVVVQTTAAGAQARRTITGTGTNITVINGDGISGNPTIDTGANVYTRSQSSLLNYLASATPAQGQIPMGQSDGSYILTKPNAGAGVQITYTNGVMTIMATGAGTGGGGGYATIQEEGTPLTQRTTMNFIGAAITAADDAGNTRTNISAHTSVNSIAVTPTNGQIPIGNGTNFTVAQPTAGNGIQITSGAGTLNIGASATMFGVCNGRLTLTSGVPVTSSNVTAATTLYFSPYNGNAIGLWNLAASGWNIYNFTEKSVAIPSTTNTNYDVFLDDSQTLRTVAWTNNTTRASNIVLFDGIYVRHGQANWRYLGSFRTTGTTGQTEDSTSRRFVWNMYNRESRTLLAVDPTDSWTYSTASYREINGGSSDGVSRFSFILGQPTEVSATATYLSYNDYADISASANAIGLDSSTAKSSDCINAFAAGQYNIDIGLMTTATLAPNSSTYRGYPGIGYHNLRGLEWGDTSGGTITWIGDNNSGGIVQTGLIGAMCA